MKQQNFQFGYEKLGLRVCGTAIVAMMVLALSSCQILPETASSNPSYDFGFSASNWYATYTKSDGNLRTPDFQDQTFLSYAPSQLNVSGVSLYRGTSGVISRAVLSTRSAWVLRVKYKPNFRGSYGYTQVYLLASPGTDQAVNTGTTTIAVNSASGFTTHHSFNGSVVVADDNWLYVRFQSLGNGTITRTFATGNYADSGGNQIEAITINGISAQYLSLMLFYVDCQTTPLQPSISIAEVTLAN